MLQKRSFLLAILLIFALAAILLAGCGSSGPAPTPTPTKTPTPAEAMNPTQPPLVGSQPIAPGQSEQPATAAPAPVAPTATPVPPSATQPSPEQPTATPTPPPTPPTDTPPPPPSNRPVHVKSPDYGAQAFLWWRPETADRDLGLMSDVGFHWVKQWFAWQDIEGAGPGVYDWSISDRIVKQVAQHQLNLLVRVSPSDKAFWAGDPPENADQFARFVGDMAARYRGRIHAYQIWNEPNLSREWGGKPVDPASYAMLLKKAYAAIKANDPNAIVITAGMAPTTADQADAMYDIKFYTQMYEAMGGNSDGYFDMLGIHAAGYALPPETDPADVATNPKYYNNDPSPAERLRVYSFRHAEDIRKLMERYGDVDKQIAILEFGWTWDDRPDSPYYWHGAGAGINMYVQGDYLVRAYQWAEQHWPWVGVMSLIYMPDPNWTKQDEQYYWAIMDPSPPGETYWRPAIIKLCIHMNGVEGRSCKYDPNK